MLMLILIEASCQQFFNIRSELKLIGCVGDLKLKDESLEDEIAVDEFFQSEDEIIL